MGRRRRAFLAGASTIPLAGCLGVLDEWGTVDESSKTRSRTATRDRGGGPAASDAESMAGDESASTEREDATTLAFAGDAMLGRSLNDRYGESGAPPASLWGDFQSRLEAADAVCCNLECCLSTRGDPYPYRDYHFRGDPRWARPALEAANVRFASLANNHAMDYGPVALRDTINHLDAIDVAVGGAGATPEAAWLPTTFTVNDVAVSVVAVSTVVQAYAATRERAGTAWAAPDVSNTRTLSVVGDAIQRAKATNPDVLVASVHWGDNWVEVPQDELVAFGHWLVDAGVDVVHGHSAHVVQAVELYADGVVLHDTGNFVNDFGVNGDLGNDKNYLFELAVVDGDVDAVRLVPFHVDDGVSSASTAEAAWLRAEIRSRSSRFGTTYERANAGLRVDR